MLTRVQDAWVLRFRAKQVSFASLGLAISANFHLHVCAYGPRFLNFPQAIHLTCPPYLCAHD